MQRNQYVVPDGTTISAPRAPYHLAPEIVVITASVYARTRVCVRTDACDSRAMRTNRNQCNMINHLSPVLMTATAADVVWMALVNVTMGLVEKLVKRYAAIASGLLGVNHVSLARRAIAEEGTLKKTVPV
ncbi:hypothetical protein X801_07618, partial [Opisthorchis viverrini]